MLINLSIIPSKNSYYRITGYFHRVQIFMTAAILTLAENFMIQKFTRT